MVREAWLPDCEKEMSACVGAFDLGLRHSPDNARLFYCIMKLNARLLYCIMKILRINREASSVNLLVYQREVGKYKRDSFTERSRPFQRGGYT